MKIRYFIRKRTTGYFSIEEIFSSICRHLKGSPDLGLDCELDEVPFHFSPMNFFRNIFYVRRRQGEINHITGDIHYAILGCSRKNLNVLTIHDCVILTKYRRWDIRYWIFRILWYEWPMAKADIVTVISEKTKNELVKGIWSGRKKIRVVNNFVDPVFTYTPRKFKETKPVFLFIGSTPNKNLDKVLEAIAGVDCKLDIVGKLSASQQVFIENNKLDVSVSYGLSRAEIVEKYIQSDLVLFPSLYEGFGMLIVEANAVGRPVVTSDISPLREVAADAAILVDPYDAGAIRDAVLKIIRDETLRERLIANGRINVKRFQIETIIKNYIRIYECVE
ncbi:MAG: glycosyltransferase family 4 protein [Chitinophagaceae bacterium]|nr:glycosyltransferase family 4 protein [Chitinophagaceae bacterium]